MMSKFELVREKKNLVLAEHQQVIANREQKGESSLIDDPRSEEEMKDQERAANDRQQEEGREYVTKADEELDIIFKAS